MSNIWLVIWISGWVPWLVLVMFYVAFRYGDNKPIENYMMLVFIIMIYSSWVGLAVVVAIELVKNIKNIPHWLSEA